MGFEPGDVPTEPPAEGVDRSEWQTDRCAAGRGQLLAEDVAHVLRHVELTPDTLRRSTSRSPNSASSSTTRSPTTRTTRHRRGRAARGRARRRRRRALAQPSPAAARSEAGRARRGRHERHGASVPARDRPGRSAVDRGRAPAGAADRGGSHRRPEDRRGRRRLHRAADVVALRAARRARQERADPGQPAAGGEYRQALLGARDAAARPDPGGQPRPDAGGRQVRPHQGLQVLDVCHVVDPPGDHPVDRRSGADDPDPCPHGRAHEPVDPDAAPDAPGARARAHRRGARRPSCRWSPSVCASCCGSRKIRCRSTRRWGRRTSRTSPTSSRTTRSTAPPMPPPRRCCTRPSSRCWAS